MEQFGKYQLTERIGVGGMAEVYVARAHGLEGFVKEVVIKRILPTFSEDPDFVDMFIAEARLAARLNHANVVQIHDFDQVDGSYYIAMEWVDGADLRRISRLARHREQPIPQAVAIHVAIETLKGLHYAHSFVHSGTPFGLVHRDISPHNLLVSYSGDVKIADFGIAKVAAHASATRTGMVKGKLAYMSPEQVRGEEVGQASDIYSLGVVLWELLAGRRLHGDRASEGELIAAVRRGIATDLGAIRDDIPESLCAVVNRMLAPDPSERFSGADEVLAALGPLSSADHGLSTGAYLSRLMPEAAERHKRGRTEMVPSPKVAPGDARTRTVDGGSDAAVSQGPVAEQTTHHLPQRAPWAKVLLLLLSTAGVGFLMVYLWPSAVESPRVSLEVNAAGGVLYVDGVALAGASPHTLEGPRGQGVSLVLKQGDQSTERRVRFGADTQVDLTIKPKQASPAAVDAAADVPAADVVSGVQPADAAVAAVAVPSLSPKKRKSPRPHNSRRQSVRATGSLDIVVFPWAKARIGKRDLGTTPIRGLALPVGVHRISLTNAALKRVKNVAVRIRANKPTKVTLDWTK